ncbi:hypothetical protein AN218_23050 [Streptomyces nanshensis]|uniref:D-inositol 3-phosphate glycosyltransferase n=2 Tax=Streptomyces nanshensis TaxID=518642 RepID=A0A1E7KZH2_9ACTN|nr:hypothetical protein AN218_23050 [Streptomyces nanshensis]
MCTYDVRGTLLDTGVAKPVRETGLVTHTHQLLHGLLTRHPRTRMTVTYTGAEVAGFDGRLRTPEGHVVELQQVATRLPQYLNAPGAGGKCAQRVRHFYEETVEDPANPVWRALAGQYALAIRSAAAPVVLLQNTNPIVAVLKAHQLGLVDTDVHLVGVVHDAAEAESRFCYLARRAAEGAAMRLIAVSDAIRTGLLRAGVPDSMVQTVHNGLDLSGFRERLRRARAEEAFARVRARNGIPGDARIVLVSARRVAWKGHEDVIDAARLLKERGLLEKVAFVFNGAGLVDSRAPHYEEDLARAITRWGLEETVFLLDDLNPTEVASCYAAADVAVLASREPEPFGYANIEAMLAGTPVITTGHGGPLEYISHRTSGLLIPPRDPAALADALKELLHDAALHARLSEGGQRSAERFTLDAMVDGYEAALTVPVASPLLEGSSTR